MELSQALRLDIHNPPTSVAFVGAGGKSTIMFQCARSMAGPVLVTATTHLSLDQLRLADQHFFVHEGLFDQLESSFPSGITLITGGVTQDGLRTQGLRDNQLGQLHKLADRLRVPLMVEADGSRRRPLKSPADHEPCIPEFADLVVVVAGLLGLGKPLTPEWVHRPERFSSISGIQIGEIITPLALTRVLVSTEGSLKNIPPQARKIVLLNQADTTRLKASAASLKMDLLQFYDALIISSFKMQNLGENRKLFVDAVYERIASVILAAGESTRFGKPKQLLNWHGKPLIWHVAHKAIKAGLHPVVAVTGAEYEPILKVLDDLPVEVIHNPNFRDGQGLSVSLGTQVVSSRCSGILFLLADQPQIPVTLIRALIEAHSKSLNLIIGPMIDGQRGNPVLFDRATFEDLAALSGKVGGRKLFSKYPVDWIPWFSDTALLDVDTPENYHLLLEMDL
jgi:molybdenum cofactor cytidylyltransferase